MSEIHKSFLIVVLISLLSLIMIGVNLKLRTPSIIAPDLRKHIRIKAKQTFHIQQSGFKEIDSVNNISILIDFLLRDASINENDSVPTKLPKIMPTTQPTTVPTTVPTKVPTKMSTTVPTKVLTTVPTTRVYKNKAANPTPRPDHCASCFPQSSYIFPNKDVCSTEHPKSQHIKLLLLIFTTHENTKQREVLRKTWTSIAENNTARLRYVFLLGKHEDPYWNNKALTEAIQYRDIVMKDFKEAYKNLTLKTMSGFQWAFRFCSNAQYVMKTDDDMWVYTPKLLRDIDTWNIYKEVVGYCLSIDYPHREIDSKWYVSPLEYPHSEYPGFCSGTGYVTSMRVLQAIVDISPHVPYFFLEDIYIAICIRKLGYRLRRLDGFNQDKVMFDPCTYKEVITSHYVTLEEVETAWTTRC